MSHEHLDSNSAEVEVETYQFETLLVGAFDIDNPEQLTPIPPLGLDPEIDVYTRELEDLEKFYRESENLEDFEQ